MLRVLRFGASKEAPRPELVDPLRALANLAANGDRRAQRTLLVELGPSLLRTARAILGAANPEVEDALQESMAALVSALPGFRGECTVRHFSSRVAIQTALNVRRRARLRTKYIAVALGDELLDVMTDGCGAKGSCHKGPTGPTCASFTAYRGCSGEMVDVPCYELAGYAPAPVASPNSSAACR